MKRSQPKGAPGRRSLLRNWSITRKLSVALLLAALVPMIFIATFNLWRGLQDAEETAEQNLELLAISVASRMNQLLHDNQAAVKQISSNSELVQLIVAPPEELRIELCEPLAEDKDERAALWAERCAQSELCSSVGRTLEGILASDPYYEYIYIMDSEGTTLISRQLEGLSRLECKNWGDRAYFLQAMEGNTYIDVLVGRASGRLGFYFSTPVEDTDGTIVGVAVLKLQGEAITEVINEFNIESESSFAFLVDQDGVIVSHPSEEWHYHSVIPLSREDQQKVGLRFVLPGCSSDNLEGCTVESLDIAGLEPLAEIAAPGNLQYKWPSDGTDRTNTEQIMGCARTETIGWIVGVNQGRAEFEEPLRQLYLQSGISVLAVGVLVALLALGLARGIARPIGQLAAAAQDVEEDKPFEPENIADVTALGDEVGHLARVFSDMVLALRARMAELRTVYQIGQDITATLEVEETLQALLDRVRDVVPYDAAEITLLDRQENTLIVTAWRGAEEYVDTRGRSYKLGVGFTGAIGQERHSLLVPDIQAETERETVAQQLTDDIPIRSLLGVPLLIRDHLVGTLEMVSSRVSAFDENDQRLLETIAPQAAIAIEKAQQVREREQRLKNQIERLRIEIDEAKRQRHVEQIVESDYFQALRQKARNIRKRSKE
jgi:putative methionine-R-sulfoxide reductase with GAF domain/HAMP domain-containing protein